MTVPILPGLAALAARYDGLILDLWGVLHDGMRPYAGAVDCLRQLKAAGKRTVILSNAPRRAAVTASRMAEIGISRDLYDGLLTSGEATWRALAADKTTRSCLFIGSTADRAIFTGLDATPTDDPAAADFVLVTGIDGREAELPDYEPLLAGAAVRKLPLICANPDLVVIYDGRPMVCAGALAARYAELGGGAITYYGKPHGAVYETCIGLLGGMARRRILAVGDSLHTDIAGARAAGVDALLVTGGIHRTALGAPPDSGKLAALCTDAGIAPDAAVRAFIW